MLPSFPWPNPNNRHPLPLLKNVASYLTVHHGASGATHFVMIPVFSWKQNHVRLTGRYPGYEHHANSPFCLCPDELQTTPCSCEVLHLGFKLSKKEHEEKLCAPPPVFNVFTILRYPPSAVDAWASQTDPRAFVGPAHCFGGGKEEVFS